jgi:CBS domain-containing protein
MKVSEVMNTSVHAISSSAMLSEAAKRMKKYGVGLLPVLAQNSIVSVLTDRDVVVRAIAEGKDPKMTPVKDITNFGIFSCSKNTDIQIASQLMKNKQMRWLLVLSEDHTVVGMLSLNDLALKTNDRYLVCDVMKAICGLEKVENET